MLRFFIVFLILAPTFYLPTSVSASPDKSPNKPWPSDMFEKLNFFEEAERSKRNWFERRFYDFIDTFRLDAGVGLAAGVEVRPTQYLQTGYRKFNPVSYRVGFMGRRKPYMVERTNQKGFSLAYNESPDRDHCDMELGLGIDLIIPGVYAAICPIEIIDFFFGITGYDMLDDD